MHIVCERGVDGLALTKIAAQAGLSNGPLYGRYDSPEDVALEMWDGRLRGPFLELVDELATFVLSHSDAPTPRLLAELETPSQEITAALEILAVARRFPMLADTVRTDVDKMLDDLRSRVGDEEHALMVSVLSVLIGMGLFAGLLDDIRPPAPMLSACLREIIGVVRRPEPPRPEHRPELTLRLPVPDSGDVALDTFVSAVMQVVSKVGYERTTAQRVARAAGQSFSTAYLHVESKDELMTLAISAMSDQILQLGDTSLRNLEIAQYRAGVDALTTALASNRNRMLRQLRVECVIAARHHPELAVALRKPLTGVVIDLPRVTDSLDQSQVDRLHAMWFLSRCHGMGSIVLSLNSPALAAVDWWPLTWRVAEVVYQPWSQEPAAPTD